MIKEKPCAPVLMVDNKSAIALAKNPVLHDRSKHIDTKFHFICDCVDGGQIKLEYVETARGHPHQATWAHLTHRVEDQNWC